MRAPTPIKSDLRFSARVDYFPTASEAVTFAALKRREGFNVNGGGRIDSPLEIAEGRFAGLFGVHWIDRKGEGFYG